MMKEKIPTRSEPHPVTYNERIGDAVTTLTRVSKSLTGESKRYVEAAIGYLRTAGGEPPEGKAIRMDLALLNLDNWLRLGIRDRARYGAVKRVIDDLKAMVREIERERRPVRRMKATILDRAVKMVRK